MLKNFNETSGNFQFSRRGLQTLWCNFKLSSVMKKFGKNCGKTLKNRRSKVFGEILEYGKILQSFLENLGKNFAEM